MDSRKIIEMLNQEPEMNPDLHDGSYELMREIVESYSHVDSYSVLNFKDLNAVYAMAIGTWKLNVEKKKEYVNAGHLPDDEKETMADVIDDVWDKACRGKYSNREGKGPSIGMFGTGFYSFERTTDDISCQKFIKLLVDIADMEDDNQIYKRAEMVFTYSFKGMQAAAASVMLHCLKPNTFPILNSNYNAGTIFSSLGIDLQNESRLVNYIDNCRRIKQFRDSNLKIKNYRILDNYPRLHPELFTGVVQQSDNQEERLPEYSSEDTETITKPVFNKNTILYGPPGTGKTFNTVLYAVAIVEKKLLQDIQKEAVSDYKAVKDRYEEYKRQGRIVFTTFHQSYGYEEFIEGIRPVMEDSDKDVEYSIEDGIFKDFCKKASVPVSTNNRSDLGLNSDPYIWKVSLYRTHDNPIRQECMDNNHIRVGFSEYSEDLSEEEENISAPLNAFYNKMEIGDIVLSCYTNETIDAIGVITGDAEYHKEYSSFNRLRKVKWLVKGINENIVSINGGTKMTLSTVYQMKVALSDVLSIVDKYTNGSGNINNYDDNFVFVIDEINRGNISKIFGELITLLEENKRIGAPEELKVKLPYSHQPFGVPSNVYILGTMNTADRSIAIMDTALRRRFSFVEMLPDSDVLRQKGNPVVFDNGISVNVADMLDIINERIMFLYDREHTIGHAFFMPLISNPSIETLAVIFEKSIIPLLQEYFYEDYAKIQLVLGDDGKIGDKKQYQFIADEDMDANKIFETVQELDSEKKYSINYPAFQEIESYKYISKKL